MKTAELTGAALNWAVAKCEGLNPSLFLMQQGRTQHHYSTDWAQGGPIIEREIDAIYRTRTSANAVTWEAMAQGDSDCMGYGTTPLIAAMRCYVASKLGDDVKVPNDLL